MGTRKLAQAAKGKRAGRARQMYKFLCFLTFFEDKGTGYSFSFVFFLCLLISFLCLAVYGEKEKGAPY